MNRHENTSMAGSVEAFLTTRWSAIDKIAADCDTPDHALINELLKKYWKPVYCFLRRKGYDNEKAKDLTQGFFEEVVLGKELIRRADRSRGRFRTFLLTALEQYLARMHRKQTARKRIPKDKILHLEQIDQAGLAEPLDRFSAEQSFNYAWITELLDNLLVEVEARCHSQGRSLHWQVFHDRVLQPIIENTRAPSLKQICLKYNIEDRRKASNMIVTVNRRFQSALKRHLRRSVISDGEVDKELRELMRIISLKAQDR